MPINLLIPDLQSAELAVLGAVVASAGEALDEIALRGDDFNDARHGELYDLMVEMHAAGTPVDPVTLSSRNPTMSAFYWGLTEQAPFRHAVEAYAEIVASHGMHRRLQGVAAGILGLSPEMSTNHMLERSQQLLDAAAGEARSPVRYVRDILPNVLEKLRTKATFIPTPWPTLNAAIGGLRPGAVYVIAARPGIGKTVIAGQIAAALAEHGRVAFSSLEMSEEELVQRLVSERLAIQVGALKDNRMSDRDWSLVADGEQRLQALNIAIDDRASVSGVEVRAHAQAVSRDGVLVGVVVDYLQLMTSRNKGERYAQVTEFSRQMKIMAKDLKVPVIALSQLNRQSENRADREPKLSDLRESGAIEQDADVVILLRREGDWPNEHIILDVAKNRHGMTGEVDLAWQGEFSRAVEWNS